MRQVVLVKGYCCTERRLSTIVGLAAVVSGFAVIVLTVRSGGQSHVALLHNRIAVRGKECRSPQYSHPFIHPNRDGACRGTSFVPKESTADGEGKEDEEENKGRKTSVSIPQIYLPWFNIRKKRKIAVAHRKAQLDYVFKSDSLLLVAKSEV
jgi:hypothetical protein